MTINAKSDAAKAGRVRNAGTSQAVSQKAGDNVFDSKLMIMPYGYGYAITFGPFPSTRKHFLTLDDLMTFLASEAIEKMQRIEQ
jgi:hypothetical protein